MRIEALELIYLASAASDAETRIAERLTAWRRRIWERDASVCRYAAAEWRRNPLSSPLGQVATDLRERSAEACDLCADRIAPHLRPTSAQPKDPNAES